MPGKVFKMALGCFRPQDKERRTSDDIQRKITAWMKDYNKAIKILLLGAGESGKTTIIKQMKILHFQGFSETERIEKVREIRANVLESIVMIVKQMSVLNIPLESKYNQRSFEFLQNIDLTQDFEYTPEFFNHVENIWKDRGIRECYDRGPEFQLPDCTKYFLDRVSSVGEPEYIPSDEDILHSRRTTTDIQKIEFQMKIPKRYGHGYQNFWMFDVGGQKGERRKWIQVFDGIHTILFLVACNVFDQFLVEDPSVNRLQESISLFQDVWSSRFLQEAGFIAFLNKQDLLKKKVDSGVSIGHYFPDYYNYKISSKDGDTNDEYIKTRCFIRDLFWYVKDITPPQLTRKFSLNPNLGLNANLNHAHETFYAQSKTNRECYWHYTTATDTNNIQTVFEDVHHMIINQHLETLGLA